MIAFLADLHLGTKLPQIDYMNSLNLFFELIKKHEEPCHAIIVCGDLFDHRLTIDDAKFASLFLLNLVWNHCGRNGKTHVPVRIIHGTYSHDYDQMPIFIPILQELDNVDVQYFKEICSGTIPNGKSVLYLPQMYGNVDYSTVFSQKYDIIVGHGPIASKIKSPCPASNSEIVLPVEKLGEISNICVFGHYHNYTDFGNNVYYTGPWLRWQYNEDAERVFFFCNDNFEVETYKNPFALEYKTIEIHNPEQLREIIAQDITTPHRFVIHTDHTDLQTYHAIMNTNKRNQNLSYKIATEEPIIEENKPETTETTSTIVEPIVGLLDFIDERYHMNLEKEVREYEDKINKNKDN